MAVCQKLLPGFGELMRTTSLQYVPRLFCRGKRRYSRQNIDYQFTGRPKSIRENLGAVFPAVPYCIDLIGGRAWKPMQQ